MNYYENPAISASGLKLIARSPAHFKAGHQAATESMKFGTMSHCAILEPHEFDNRYTVIPEGLDKRSKEGKAAFEAVIATGKEPVRFNDMQDIFEIQKAVQAHPEFNRIMRNNPEFEREFFLYRDGVEAKMKCDIIIAPCSEFPHGLIYDLKSVPDASPDKFFRSMWNSNGFIQSAWYTDLFMRHYGTTEPPQFWWQPVEKKPPYLTAIYKCAPDQLDYGQRQVEKLMEIYLDCCETGDWYGYDNAVTELTTPDWAAAAMMETEIEFISEETNDE